MKYILKKDLPFAKAGTEWKIIEPYNNPEGEYRLVDINNATTCEIWTWFLGWGDPRESEWFEIIPQVSEEWKQWALEMVGEDEMEKHTCHYIGKTCINEYVEKCKGYRESTARNEFRQEIRDRINNA